MEPQKKSGIDLEVVFPILFLLGIEKSTNYVEDCIQIFFWFHFWTQKLPACKDFSHRNFLKIGCKTGFRPQKLDLKKIFFCSDFQFEVVQIRGVLHFLGGSDTVYGSRLPGHFSTKLRSPGRNLFYLGLVIIVTEVSLW